MQYKSFADIPADISRGLAKIPGDVDLVVGVPRSGLMVASVLALTLNIRFCDLSNFCADGALRAGRTRRVHGGEIDTAFQARHVLVVDDSICSGGSIAAVKAEVEASGYPGRVTYMALYATKDSKDKIDLFFEVVPTPRIFQWNLFHRQELADCCIDIDGVLCVDPTGEQNDDGDRYRQFLLNAQPIVRPTYLMGHLVTSRLEKYRPETEAWLAAHQMSCKSLHMLDLPTAVERRRLGCHAEFKAQVYSSIKTSMLFIESEETQARDIARISGKPVLYFGDQRMIYPGTSWASMRVANRTFMRRVLNRIKTSIR